MFSSSIDVPQSWPLGEGIWHVLTSEVVSMRGLNPKLGVVLQIARTGDLS